MKHLVIVALIVVVAGLLQSAYSQEGSMSTTAGWVVQTSPTTKVLWDVHAISGSVAWALGPDGLVLRTTNGGTLWSTVATSLFPGTVLEDLEPLDDQKALLAVATNDQSITAIMRTTNAGAKWDTVFTQTGAGFLTSIRMFDQDNGMAIGLGVPQPKLEFTVLRTTNGGISWSSLMNLPVGLANGILPWGLTSVGSSFIWFAGNDTRFQRSTNGGAGWESIRPFPGTSIVSLWFADPLNGVLSTFRQIPAGSTAGMTTAWTSDGGTNWTPVVLPDSGVGGCVVGTGLDFFITNGTKVYRSTDRGHTWSTSYPGGIGTINTLGVIIQGSNLICWGVSAGGDILRGDFVKTGVAIPSEEIPTVFALAQNFPNPFNPSTVVRYDLPFTSEVRLVVCDILGRQVSVLVNERKDAGMHQVSFDASGLPSGVYFYRIQAGDFVSTKRMVVLK
jgi:photosystem II stability/assembly factor-like uncharacterized protein